MGKSFVKESRSKRAKLVHICGGVIKCLADKAGSKLANLSSSAVEFTKSLVALNQGQSTPYKSSCCGLSITRNKSDEFEGTSWNVPTQYPVPPFLLKNCSVTFTMKISAESSVINE